MHTKGRETNYTFKYLNFNTKYTFEVSTRFSKGDLGEPVHAVITTGPFSAPVGPLKAAVHADNSVTLSWSAPQTIDVKKFRVRIPQQSKVGKLELASVK